MSTTIIAGILLEYLAPVLARMAFAKALGGTISPEDVAESLSELGPFAERIKTITGDRRAAKQGSRLFEDAGEIAAENLAELFEREGDRLDEERLEPIVQDAANLLEKNGLRLLIDAGYDSTKFIKAVGELPIADLRLDAHEMVFMRRLLQDSGRILFTVAEKLPHFERENAARLLQNDALILQEVREAVASLKRIEAVSQQNNPEEKAANFERDYRRLLADDLDKLKLFGIPQIDNYYQPLTMAFVQVNAVQWELVEKNTRVDVGLLGDLKSALDDVFQKERVQESAAELMAEANRMVIVGPAGAGKTTLLKWMAVRVARQDETMPEQWQGKIPFYVRVRDYADKDWPTHNQLPVQFGQTKNLQGDVPEGWVDRQLRSGRGMVLLDGLDEVRAEKRAEAFAWLNGLLTRYEAATYVISTRPATLEDEATRRWLHRLGFEQFRLRNLEPEQIEQFITQWHEALGDDACSLPQAEKADLPQLAEKLRRVVVERAQLRDLARNPLLCAMLCALHHRYKRELPQNRVRLYQLCLETLLDGRDAERGVDMRDYELALNQITHVRPYLGRAAYWMMRHDQSVIGREELRRQLQLPENEAVATQLMNYLVERSALLQEQAKDEFDFVHRSFLEYLAAERLVHDGDTTVEILGERAKEERWRDTLRLVAGLGNEQDKQNLLQALIKLYDLKKYNWLGRFVLECYDWMVAPSIAIQNTIKQHTMLLIEEQSLDLRDTDITTIPPLDPSTSLDTLFLINTFVSDIHLPALVNLFNLENLYLGGTMISDASLPILAQIPKLKLLDLDDTLITDFGLSVFAQFPKLEILSLENTAITDGGLHILARIPKLRWLYLRRTRISDASLLDISYFPKLELLALDRTMITDAGMRILAQNLDLQWIFLSNTTISDAGLQSLTQLSNLEGLDLEYTSISDDGLIAIASFKKLQHLALGNTFISDVGLHNLAQLTDINVLRLNNTGVSDDGLPIIAQLTGLRVLFLNDTAISDAGLQALTALTNLKRLHLDNTNISDAGLLHLARLNGLQHLYLSNTAVTPAAIEKFKQNHPREIVIAH